MKKWLASILAVLITAAGFTVVDQALVDRVDTLERQVSSMQDVLNATETMPTSQKALGFATIHISYSIVNSGEGEKTTSFSVTEGDAITLEMVENAVRSQLSGKYTIYDIVIRSGSAVSAAEPITYNFHVIVDADEL